MKLLKELVAKDFTEQISAGIGKEILFPKEAMKELDKLEKEIEKYTSRIRKDRKSNKREWKPSNKYRTNYKTSF